MGLFKRSKSVDLEEIFKTKYKEINKIIAEGQNELDLQIQISLFTLAYEKYNDLLALIDQGVNYDRKHFEILQRDLKKQIDLLKGLENEN
ncbi:hypothetical protein [Thomasclavelia sp.]